MSRRHSTRRVTTFLVAAAVLLTSLVIGGGATGGLSGQQTGTAVSEPQLELAADLRAFRPGNIISDNLFFDGGSMPAGEIQAFMEFKGASCVRAPNGPPCLKDFRQDTPNKPADAYCGFYPGAPGETAAWIIAKIGQACGISQRALLVILQKEQGVVTTRTPVHDDYRKAMGFGCPDTPGGCDAAYAGFFYQVYKAAWQFKRYAANPKGWGYQAGRSQYIQYDVETSCGGSQVYIENQATAGLYIYTPYQPNAASIGAGYGPAEPCGSYGNRNFFSYYTDWFGSTQSPGGNAVVARATVPATAGMIGAPVTGVVCGIRDGGCFQSFQHASIYWSPASGARVVLGAIRDRWAANGWEAGIVGYPTTEERCGLIDGGCVQFFQRGGIYWSPTTGAHTIMGAIADKWAATGFERGPLGYPTAEERCGLAGGGCLQAFETTAVYWSPASGAHPVATQVADKWAETKWERGPLGYPTTDGVCGLRDNGCQQIFTGGAIVTSTTTGAHAVLGPTAEKWKQTGWEGGALGYPTADTVCGLRDGGCTTTFAGGTIAWAQATGARVVTGAVLNLWTGSSAQAGPLGYPVSDTECGLADAGCSGSFQYGSVYDSASTDPAVVTGAIGEYWRAAGADRSVFGYPSEAEKCGLARGGCLQQFQQGTVYWSSATGTHGVTEPVLAVAAAPAGGPGRLGYPTGERTCGLAGGGCAQAFEIGTVYTSTAGGTRSVWGDILGAWTARGAERGVYGYPTGAEVCGQAGGGCSQPFQGGSFYWTAATKAHAVGGAIGVTWNAAGGQAGAIGYPVGREMCGLVRGGCAQFFQRAGIYWSPATGAHSITGPIADAWGATGWERGTLGYPAADAVTTATEISQRFERGTLVQNRSTGKVTTRR